MKTKRIISLLASLAMMVTAVTGAMTVSVVSAADDYVTSGKIGENASWVVNTDDVLVISGQGDINGSGGWSWSSNFNYHIAEVVVEDGITSVTNTTYSRELISGTSCKSVSKITLPPSLTKLQGCLDRIGVFRGRHLKDIYIYSKNITDAASVKGDGIYPEGMTWHVYKDSETDKSLRNDLGLNDEDIEYIPANEKMPAITNKTPAQVEPLTNTSGPAGITSKWEWNESSKTLTFSGAGYIYGYGDETENFTGYKKYSEKTEHIAIKSGITSIGLYGFIQTDTYNYNGAFCNFTALKDVELPDTLRIIGDGVFGKSNLTKIEFPQTVEKIGRNAFSYTELKEISFSENIKFMGQDAFSNTKLKSINLHEGMFIGGGAFVSCESLKEVTIPPNCSYGRAGGQGLGGFHHTFCYCTGLEKVIFENGVTELSVEGMFGGCTALKAAYFYTADLQSIGAVTSTAPTFEKNNNITFHVVKDSTTEQTLKDAGYLTADNTVYLADTTALETAISEAEAIETDKYTDESVSALTKAIENAKAVLENLNATQDEVDSAVKAIEDAKNALAEKPDEPSSSDPSDSSDPSNSSDNNNQSQSPNTPATPSTSAPTTATPKPTTPPTVTTTVAKPAKVKSVKLKAKKKKLNVSWKKVSGATGYEVMSATNNKFTKNKKTVTVKKNKVTLKKLKPKKKYFVKVRAYKLANGRKYFGKWSKVVKKKTK